jgi:cyclopropane-fatty-acyl-phospholipid synthase
MDGLWSCDDLVALVRILVRNRDLLDRMETGLARLGGWALRGLHALRRNTRSGSRRNIAAHYDLGNEFFSCSSTRLMYFVAIFADPGYAGAGLDPQARAHLPQARAAPGDQRGRDRHRLGRLRAARGAPHGCRVTTTTISREQHAWPAERVAAAGLSDRVTLLLEDYRDLEGRYDKLVSIEMIEAIGHQYLDTYFGKVGSPAGSPTAWR